ncbi:hypothetical protein [Marinovum algicola]|uniref:hypothetical protein n=1 Tax=Marinovum algicola TaxID=42444 RepID=UPI00352AF32A
MEEIRLPLSIVYKIDHAPTASEVIDALRAADAISTDIAALLPSLIDGLAVERSSLCVRSLTESSLKEALFVALLVTYQPDLKQEVPAMLEQLFDVTVSDKYDSLATVVFLIVLVYGSSLAIDIARRAFTDSIPRQKLNELVELLALETGKSSGEIRKIVEARFQKPAAAKRVVRDAMRFFRPSQIGDAAPVLFDRDEIGTDAIKQLPFPKEVDNEHDFNRYEPYSGAILELHAQDRDKAATGWAAVAKDIHDRRLKVRVVEPVQPSDLWGQDEIVADIVVVKKLTSDGYTPAEIQVTAVWPEGDPPVFSSARDTD